MSDFRSLLALCCGAVATSAFAGDAANPLQWEHQGVKWQGSLEMTSSPAVHLEEKYGKQADAICESASVKQLSGYFKVTGDNKKDLNYFFWFFESRNANASAPVGMWLTGGPGCSSMLALVGENGPCQVNHDVVPPASQCTATGSARNACGNSTITEAQCNAFGCCFNKGCFTPDTVTMKKNDYSWNNLAHMMWIDQPAGVGFSYGAVSDYDKDEAGVAEDMFYFLKAFFAANPQYAPNPFFVFGESYGGHYAPSVADRIFQGVKNNTSSINLKGLGVGNGLTDPSVQYKYYAQMAYNNSYGIHTVTEQVFNEMTAAIPKCVSMIGDCQTKGGAACKSAQSYCNDAMLGPYEATGLNPYNIKVKCDIPGLCYDFSLEGAWLNEKTVWDAIGVDSSKVKSWQSCNYVVNSMFSADWMADQQQKVSDLLEGGVNVLIYAGDLDFVCNWLGNKAWTLSLPWSGQASFNAAGDKDWITDDGSHMGTARSSDGFTFLQVFEAGHMVPADQPKAALALFNTLVFEGSF